MAGIEYEFTDEGSIDRDLECIICSRPFEEPHCTQCGHIYCKKCITVSVARNSSCPLCRGPIKLTDLKKADAISYAINQLLVTCKKCGQSDILQGQFNDHIKNHCSQTSCPIRNFKQIAELIDQPLKQIQGLKKEIERQKTELNNNNTQINNTLKTINEKLKAQQDEIHSLKQSNDTQQRSIQELERRVKIQEEKIEDQEESIVQLERNNRRLHSHSNEYKTQIQNLEEQMKQLLPSKHDELEDYITENCQFGSEFALPRDNLVDRDMEIIVRRAIINRQCSALNLRKNQITFQGVRIIAEAFHRDIRLEKLDLSYNNISDHGIQYLAEALLQDPTLKELSLGSTGITNQGIKYLTEMLQLNKILNKLYLYENNFDDDGMILLTNVLSGPNQTLKELSLHLNRLTDKSVNTIIDMFKQNRSLERIELAKCDFSSGVKTRLRDAAKNASITIDI